MSGRRGRTGASVVLATAGGLALAGGTSAAWVETEVLLEVGGVTVTDVAVATGLELAPQGLGLGLAAVAAGLALLVLRGRAQVAAGVALVLAGAAACAFVLAGLGGDAAPEGDTAGGAVAAIAGAVAVVAAGVLALRPAPPPRLPARYDLDAPEAGEDEEWRIASVEEPGDAAGDGGRA